MTFLCSFCKCKINRATNWIKHLKRYYCEGCAIKIRIEPATGRHYIEDIDISSWRGIVRTNIIELKKAKQDYICPEIEYSA